MPETKRPSPTPRDRLIAAVCAAVYSEKTGGDWRGERDEIAEEWLLRAAREFVAEAGKGSS